MSGVLGVLGPGTLPGSDGAGPGNEWSGHTEGYVPAYTTQATAFVASKLLAGTGRQAPGFGPAQGSTPQTPGFGPQTPGPGPSVPRNVPAPSTPSTPDTPSPQAPLV